MDSLWSFESLCYTQPFWAKQPKGVFLCVLCIVSTITSTTKFQDQNTLLLPPFLPQSSQCFPLLLSQPPRWLEPPTLLPPPLRINMDKLICSLELLRLILRTIQDRLYLFYRWGNQGIDNLRIIFGPCSWIWWLEKPGFRSVLIPTRHVFSSVLFGIELTLKKCLLHEGGNRSSHALGHIAVATAHRTTGRRFCPWYYVTHPVNSSCGTRAHIAKGTNSTGTLKSRTREKAVD